MAAPDDDFRQAVLEGLSRSDKSIPCKFLYDQHGSALFERICDLDEYYLTRTEIGLLRTRAETIAALIGPCGRLVEFGAGSDRKARLLLDVMDRPADYVPVDVSRDHLEAAVAALAADYPRLNIAPVYADFLGEFTLPPMVGDGRTIGFFPGSTIGNLSPAEARAFLKRAAHLIGRDGALLVGVDVKKDQATLEAAYNDARGVTAAFNLNLLTRINRELNGDFDLAAFEHSARYNAREGRIEIDIVSFRRQAVRVDGHRFTFDFREPLHTENSYKYAVEEFHWLAGAAGFRPEHAWIDPQGLFSLHFLRPVDRND